MQGIVVIGGVVVVVILQTPEKSSDNKDTRKMNKHVDVGM